MDNLQSFFVVLLVLAILFVPQLLVMFYAAPRGTESKTQQLDLR